MKRQALGLRKGEKGKEKLSLAFVRRIPNKPRKRLVQDTLELLSSRNVGKNQLGFRQLKEACLWTQEMKIGMSHQPPMTQKKADDIGIST